MRRPSRRKNPVCRVRIEGGWEKRPQALPVLPCNMCDMERRPITDGERIAARIDRRGACWIWSGTYAADGYPVFTSTTGNISIIPLLWKQENGPVPDGHVLTCIHPRGGSDVCVNPAHYQPRPRGAQVATQCRWGHDLTDEANVWRNAGRRYCLPCMVRRRKGGSGPTTRSTS